MQITLGKKVKDRINGYEGIVTAITSYLNNSPNRAMVEATDTTGRPIEWWIDVDRLELKED